LEEEHFNVCCPLATQKVWGLEEFPFQRAVVNSKELVTSPGKQQQQQQSITFSDSDDESVQGMALGFIWMAATWNTGLGGSLH